MPSHESDSKHPLDVFDDLAEAYAEAEAYRIGDQIGSGDPPYEEMIADLEKEIRERRDEFEAALEWYRRQAVNE